MKSTAYNFQLGFKMSFIEVKNKNILITGGGNGIGKEIVKALSPYNTLYVVDRDQEKLELLKRECPGIVPLVCDLSDWDETRKLLQEKLPEIIHGCVNNAGIGAPADVLNCTEDALDRVIAVNTRAIVNVSQIVAQRIIAFNETQTDDNDKIEGAIVNVSSLASRVPTRISLPYCVSKAAVDMLTKAMALELGSHNIRVNSVNPNIVLGTDLSKALLEARETQVKEKLKRIPLGRAVELREVVNTVIFLLASEHVGMIHGESVVIDGGFSVS